MKSGLLNVVPCARRNVDVTVSSESTSFLKPVDMTRLSIVCIRFLAGRTLHYANGVPILPLADSRVIAGTIFFSLG